MTQEPYRDELDLELEDFIEGKRIQAVQPIRTRLDIPNSIYRVDGAYREDQELIVAYDVLRNNLVHDLEQAGHLLKTADYLVVERMVFSYVEMKYSENRGGYASAAKQKSLNSLFQTYSKEYFHLLGRDDDERQVQQREEFIAAIKQATETLSKEDRIRVLRAVSEHMSVI